MSYTLFTMEDVIVIGAGVVGCFIARELSKYELKVRLFDKENDVGNVTSMANSAIVHSGYDPVPGTKKAIFNVKGNEMYPSICKDLDVEFLKTGSLTVAINDAQVEVLKTLQERGTQNGVPTEMISKEKLVEMEPNINPEAKAALFCPTAGIVDPFNLVAHCAENAIDNGVNLHLAEPVLDIKEKNGIFEVFTSKGTYEAKCVINAAGLYSDKIASMIEDIDWSINPRKGEYVLLNHFMWGFCNHPLFPLPSEKGKGILFSLTTSGNYYCGPSSESIDDKDDVSTDPITIADVKRQASLMIPRIPWPIQIRTFAGVRATPSTHDFIIEPSKKYKNFINVAGIESPGFASSPAIADYVVNELVSNVLVLTKKANWNPKVKKYRRVWNLNEEEKNALIKENPSYGTIVCNCEKVALGEIEDILSRSLPCNSIKALKKRSRASMGMCQGGFCQPKLLEILAKHKGVSPLDIPYDAEGSEILIKENK